MPPTKHVLTLDKNEISMSTLFKVEFQIPLYLGKQKVNKVSTSAYSKKTVFVAKLFSVTKVIS
jgi:hypothetical protein